MKYKRIAALFLLLTLSACGQGKEQPPAEPTPPPTTSGSIQAEPTADVEDHRILIAYFTRLDNTDGDLDDIVRGGGPYGPLGDSFEEAEVDAITSASITVLDGESYGNTEAVARMIQTETGGELFSIQTTEPYPVDYDAIIDQGGEEKNTDARPELSTQVEDMEDYDVVFLGFPNWWYDMPMPVYYFLESYDFTGKTVIPFATSASSGFSGAIHTIQDLLSDATVIEDGLHIPMREVSAAQSAVTAWVGELGLADSHISEE